MDNAPSWGLVGAGKCRGCGKNRFQWTHSLAVPAYGYSEVGDSWGIHKPQVSCLRCHRHTIDRIIRYNEENYPIADFRTLYIEVPIEEDDHEVYPFLKDCPKCFVCEDPMGEEDVVEARIADERTIIVQVHETCSINTECCNTVLPLGMFRHITSIVREHQFAYITSIVNTSKCEQCLNEYLTQEGTTLENDYFFCRSCDSYMPNPERGRWNGTWYCDTCIHENVFSCDDCGDEYWRDDDHNCYNEDDDDYDGVIHDYGYKPRPYFFGKRSDQRLYFGFELEVECMENNPTDTASEVQSLLGDRVYIKSDSSLECGFEIVSHPHSLEELQQHFPWKHFRKFRTELSLRSWNTDTCGLHVHVSRDAFGPYDNRTERTPHLTKRQAHELRFIKLIYDNESHVTRLAGRSSPGYANFMDKSKLISKVKWNEAEGGRHAAVNTFNTSTLEVRIFKGSLRPERVLSAVELVHAGVEYTRNLKVNAKNKALSWLAFAGYVHTNLEKYPNLHAYMNLGGKDIEMYDNRTESDYN